MKIGLYADPHFSQNSGVLIGREGNYSKRLDNLIKSFKWMNQLFKEEGCEEIFCLGDLTDRPDLTAEEITAISECNLSSHHLIVGNHCRSDQSGHISTLSIFEKVYSEPETLVRDGKKILILPYSSTPVNLRELGKFDLILSHNDIKGYDFGGHICTEGYDLQDILDTCDTFINGHLHNGGYLVDGRVVNLGQITGINFSSCNGQWNPSVGIYDTQSGCLEIIENPEAFKFKKFEVKTLTALKNLVSGLEGKNYVLQIKIPEKISQTARKYLSQSSKIAASRILTIKSRDRKSIEDKKSVASLDTTSVYDKLRKFISTQDPKKYNPDIVSKIIDDLEKEEGVE